MFGIPSGAGLVLVHLDQKYVNLLVWRGIFMANIGGESWLKYGGFNE